MNKKSFYAGAIGFLIGGPLGAIIGFVLGSIIFSNNKEKENNSGDGNEGGENNFKYCILVLLGEVMKADGRLMSCELDRVKATIRRYYKTESEQKSALKQFQTILDHHHNLEAICSSINKRLNYIAKSELIMELLAVAYADDHFDTTEETIIQKIVKNLNITSQEYKSIYMLFMKKYKQAVLTIQVAAAIIATVIRTTTATTTQTATAVTTMAIPTRIPATTTTADQAAYQ